MEARTRPAGASSGGTKPNRRREVEYNGVVWLDLAQAAPAEVAALRERFGFDALLLDTLQSPGHAPRLEVFPTQELLFVELHIPTLDREGQLVRSPVSLFAGKQVFVSIHDGNSKPLRRFFSAAAADEPARAQLLGRGPGHLLFRFIDTLVKQGALPLAQTSEALERLDARLDERPGIATSRELARTWRDLLTLQAILTPNQAVLERLRGVDAPFLRIDTARYFGDALVTSARTQAQLNEQLAIVNAQAAILDTRIAQRNGQVLQLIALLLLLLLPLLLLAALAALHLAVPVSEQPLSFAAAVLLTIALAVGILAFARYRNLL